MTEHCLCVRAEQCFGHLPLECSQPCTAQLCMQEPDGQFGELVAFSHRKIMMKSDKRKTMWLECFLTVELPHAMR